MLRNVARGGPFRRQWRPFSASSRAVDMAAKDGELRVFMVSGEVSGDSIASHLMASLKQISPFPIRFAGVGGDLMSKEGLQSIFPIEDIAVMGIWELLPHLNKVRRKLKETTQAALSFQPHVVLTIDSKGFSFRFLKLLRARCSQQDMAGPIHVHYVAPSFWAWKGGEARLKGLSKIVDHLLCILPIEEEVCRSNGLPATFVGHPMLEDTLNINLNLQLSILAWYLLQFVRHEFVDPEREKYPGPNKWKVQGDSKSFRIKHGISSGATVITLLPGSRLQEVTRMLPTFLETMKILGHSLPDLTSLIPVAPNRDVESFINRAIQPLAVTTLLIPGASQKLKYDAFSASHAALCTSGTATMELQLARLPCVVAYRAHLITEWFIRYKTKLQYISLPNILLNSAIIPEVLFGECKPKNLALRLSQVLNDENLREQQIAAAEKVFEMLSPSARNMNSLQSEELIASENGLKPSMIAAYTVLYSARRL